MIVATAGTTGAGMIDPLHACADIAQQQALWYHVDAAWGGAALASNRLRGALAGIERADSITIDAHKWLATTMGCALFITRRGHLLSEAFHASTSFMPSSVSGVDPYLNSVQWSRRFLGLRLFLALASAGWEGLARMWSAASWWSDAIKERLLASGWTHRERFAAGGARCRSAGRAWGRADSGAPGGGLGRAWVAPTTFEGSDVVRICATNGETTLADVDALIAVLNERADGP